MHKLIEYVCDELQELEDKVAQGNNLSSAEVQYMDMLANTKKNLLKAEEMDEGEYSGNDYYNRSHGRRSYARKRNSMGRYSRDNGMMLDELRSMMDSAPDERTRTEFKRFIDKMEQF